MSWLWLCKLRHAWKVRDNWGEEPRRMPSPYTFYKRVEQPRKLRTCSRCKKEEASMEDQFGNLWWEPRGWYDYTH